ncbi:hypothetical protein L1987_85338 [Smallanthus sonchifolius]|uniref:Uncharacterized protein n=1 Tax=Smallanthus sonchifolius TaxID=185202 RepID=A0ACB8XXF1_9ASTR|nr:hypothetical protein L1987_85338 [Smallanthus sonchifolius]
MDHLSMYLDAADSSSLPYGWSRYAQISLVVVNQVHNKFTIKKGVCHACVVLCYYRVKYLGRFRIGKYLSIPVIEWMVTSYDTFVLYANRILETFEILIY